MAVLPTLLGANLDCITQVKPQLGDTPTRDDEYVIIEPLGSGAFGCVHLAWYKPGRVHVALKCSRRDNARPRACKEQQGLFDSPGRSPICSPGCSPVRSRVSSTSQEALHRELEILTSLKPHPFIVRCYGQIYTHDAQHLVLEYVAGGHCAASGRHHVAMFDFFCDTGRTSESAGRFDMATARFIVAQVVLALRYLHGESIVHRDLKPQNLMLDRHGYVKLLDFGLAKVVPSGQKTYTCCGTPEYMSPEVAEPKRAAAQGEAMTNRGHDTLVDCWALGILASEMITGYTPFHGDNVVQTWERISTSKMFWPREFALDAKFVIAGLLAKKPSKRLQFCGGQLNVMDCSWFQDICWDSLLLKEYDAPESDSLSM